MTPMSAEVITLEQLFRDRLFRPATVQRQYQWQSEQCGALLADFERAWRLSTMGLATGLQEGDAAGGKSPAHYFLGCFVLLPVEPGRDEVFDGLQRLTTLTILFAVLRDLLDAGTGSGATRLNDLVIDLKGEPRLKLAGSDQTLANLVQVRSEAIRTRRNLSANTLRGRLLSAAGFFHSRLREKSVADLESFALFVLGSVHAGVIRVTDPSLARQIFITTNNRGVPLNEADVLQSQINAIPLRQDTAVRVLSDWQAVKSGFDQDEDYHAFLETADFLSRREGRSSAGLTALGEHLAQRLDEASLLEWMVDLERRARAWHRLQAAHRDPRRCDPTPGALFRLFAFEWPEWRAPAVELLRLHGDALADRDRRKAALLLSRFEALEIAALADTLCETSEGERVRRFARAIGDVMSGKPLATNSLALTEAQLQRAAAALSAPVYDQDTSRQVLRWAELKQRRDPAPEVLTLVPDRVLPAHQVDDSQWERFFPDAGQRWAIAHAWGNLVLRPAAGRPSDELGSFREWKRSALADRGRSLGVDEVLRHVAWTPAEIAARSGGLRAKVLSALNAQAGRP